MNIIHLHCKVYYQKSGARRFPQGWQTPGARRARDDVSTIVNTCGRFAQPATRRSVRGRHEGSGQDYGDRITATPYPYTDASEEGRLLRPRTHWLSTWSTAGERAAWQALKSGDEHRVAGGTTVGLRRPQSLKGPQFTGTVRLGVGQSLGEVGHELQQWPQIHKPVVKSGQMGSCAGPAPIAALAIRHPRTGFSAT